MDKRNRDDVDLYPSILSTSYDIAQLWEVEGEVEKFANEKDDAKEELCGLEELDNINNPTFKAGSKKNRKVSNRFDEEGVFSMNCARHGVPIRLYDIHNGEGRKYALAAISHLMSLLGNSQKLLIMYDIICLCKGKLECSTPMLIACTVKSNIIHELSMAVAIPSASGAQQIASTVEYLLLNDLRDESGRKFEITIRKDINRNNFLVDQIKQLQSVYGYAMINSLDDPALQERRERIIEVRYNVMNTFVKHLLFAILMKEHKISQPGSFGTAKAVRVILSLEILKKKAEAIISMIYKFVETSYSTQAEIDRRKKKTVGKEVERVRLYAAENGLDLPTPLNNWHILKRNVEEISILIGEAKRVLGNYEGELSSLRGKQNNHFVRMRVLDVARRQRSAKLLLKNVSRSKPPVLFASRDASDLLNNVVIFPEVDLSDDENEIYDNNEDDVVDAGDPDDADAGEGGEPNPEDESLITFQDIEEGS
ncbi:uncharacterized protein ATC70_004364 [Mucor velutinosus]|uniref:Uncharacterized protein n=1 Tax=Mucor velutinosus TaxID=708070 RepID=A0AAN7I4S7_9FUNG|nr:hypothetical protein ATC70_004364 [Mucor velutinosus]